MRTFDTAVLSLTLFCACGRDASSPPPTEQKVAEPPTKAVRVGDGSGSAAEQRALARAETAAKTLGGKLKGRVQQELRQGGPPRALEVCSTQAQELTRAVEGETGIRVGRTSLRTRNPANAGPPWVAAWLREQAGRDPAIIEPVRGVWNVDGVRTARVIKPILIEAPCLACHGDPQALDGEVREALAARYPNDQAVGYALGDLRGALWAESPVEPG